MTKEKLLAKQQDYQGQLNQLQANANALQGALQDVAFWLEELDKEARPAPPVMNAS
jgi:hypothetical protein